MPIKKYYAVAVGREGPKIYNTWDECKRQTHKYPAVFKSFSSLEQAKQWLASQTSLDGRRSHSQEAYPLQPEVSSTSNCSFLNPISSLSADLIPPKSLSQTSSYVASHSVPMAAELEILANTRVELSSEQQRVLDMVKSGQNVFFTGSAGTGKSILLREIRDTLVEQGLGGDQLGITASTGIAAVNIGGRTLHSWAGIGLGDQDADRYIGKFFGNKQFRTVLRRWQNVKTLMIDEVSMLDGSLFDKLENIARGVRNNDKPFGGIQLILSGDFCQLPPVPGRNQDGLTTPAKFAFDAVSWNACVGPPFVLTHVFRQEGRDFIDMLNAMRFGQLDQEAICALSMLSREVIYTDGIEPTELFPTRQEVEYANSIRLAQLETELHTFEAHDLPGYDFYGNLVSALQMAHLLERHVVVPQEMQLKVGAQVMLLKNLIQGELVNGSVGQIVRFETAREALSRHTIIVGAELKGNGQQELPENDIAWPVVRFIGGQEVFIIPQKFTVNNARGEMEACRKQVPLILSWALSVHKSQGKTLERVKVDLGRTFEMGQAYVALSRATSMNQLQVVNFDISKVRAHPRVIEWCLRTRHPPYAFSPGVIEMWDHESDATDATSATDVLDNEVDEELAMAWYHEL